MCYVLCAGCLMFDVGVGCWVSVVVCCVSFAVCYMFVCCALIVMGLLLRVVYYVLCVGCCMFDVVCWMPCVGCWVLIVVHCMLGVMCWVFDIIC